MHNQPVSLSARRISSRQFGYLLLAVAATAANLALWVAGVDHTIATGMLVGAACAGLVCWRQSVAEERLLARMESVATDMWWHGYATCLEDTTAEGKPRTVVPFRVPSGDKISDTGGRLNGTEVR